MTNGKAVHYEDKGSHTATHLADTPQLYQLIQDYLSKQSFHEDELQIEHNAGKIVGNTDLVETDENNDIIYAKRLNRDSYTRFVRNKFAPKTQWFTVHIVKNETGDYELVSAWIGRICPPFPDDPRATSESVPFWRSHALVFGNQAIQNETLTTSVPW